MTWADVMVVCRVRSQIPLYAVFKLWSGALPRLGRLMFSGGIVFAMYEKTMEVLDVIDPKKQYI